MKLLPIFILSFFVTFVNMNPPKIIITIENIKNIKGTIELGVYNNPSNYLDEGKAIKTISKKVTGKTITFTMLLPKDGEYAFAIYQDVNSDKVCNKNFIGIPTESYGFSKVYKSVYSKPSFKDCKINTKTEKSVRIKLLD